MKTLLTLLLGLFGTATVHASSTDTIAAVREAVVELHITMKDEPKSSEDKHRRKIENFAEHATCTGEFVTSGGLILTAKHCTEGVEKITVVTYDRQEYKATVLMQSPTQDLAVLRVDKRNTPYLPLAKSVEQGQSIHTYGSPLGITGTYTTGVVARLNGDVTYIDCGVLPGNSGGPVFNDDGELVGVATAGFIVLYGTTHLNVMQSLDSIVGFAQLLSGVR